MAPKQLPIRLPPEIRARLDAEAARLQISINAVIVVLLDRHLPPLPQGFEPPEPEPEPPAGASAARGDAETLDFD